MNNPPRSKRVRPPVPLDTSLVFPRLKPLSFCSGLARMKLSAEQMPYTWPLAGDLVVAYALDQGNAFRMLLTREVAALGMPQVGFHAVALGNLRRRLQVTISGRPPVLVLEAGGDLDACLVLLDEVWPQLASHVAGKVVVGVPTRSVLFVTGSQSQEGLALVRASVAAFYGCDPVHALSRHLFVRWSDRWDVFE